MVNIRLPVHQTTHATVLQRPFVDKYVERPLFRYYAGWQKHLWTRQDRSSCALLPTQIPVACDEHEDDHVRARIAMSPMDGHWVVLFRTQGFRQVDAGAVQGRMVRRRIRSVCAARPSTALVPLTSIARKSWANVATTLTRTLSSPCWQTDRALVGLIGAFACVIRPWWCTLKSESRYRTSMGSAKYSPTVSARPSGSVKGRDHQTTIHSPTWIRVGNVLSHASSPDRLVAVRQRLSLNCYEMLSQWSIPHPNALLGTMISTYPTRI